MKKVITIIIAILCISNSTSTAATKRVLLEEFSTAPCGFCPEGAIIAENLIHYYYQLLTFTHHAGFGTDSMTIKESQTLAAKFTNFAPAGVIDRNYHNIPVYTYPQYLAISRQKWDSIIAIHLNDPAEADIVITKRSFDKNTRNLTLDFTLSFLNDLETGDYRLNIAIIEDSVSGIGNGWDQKNYFNNDPKYPELYHKGDSIVGYIHRHVVRKMPLGAWGSADKIPSTPTKGTQISFTDFKIDNLPANWKSKDCSVIIFLSKYNDDIQKMKVLNSVQTQFPGDNISVDDKEETFGNLSVYPNPVSDLGFIHLDFQNPTFALLELYSSLGNKVRDISKGIYNSQNVYFYASDLPKGAYFIKVQTDSETKFINFIVD